MILNTQCNCFTRHLIIISNQHKGYIRVKCGSLNHLVWHHYLRSLLFSLLFFEPLLLCIVLHVFHQHRQLLLQRRDYCEHHHHAQVLLRLPEQNAHSEQCVKMFALFNSRTHTHTHTRMQAHIHIHPQASTEHTHTHTHKQEYTPTSMYTNECIHPQVCARTQTCSHTHTQSKHTHTHTLQHNLTIQSKTRLCNNTVTSKQCSTQNQLHTVCKLKLEATNIQQTTCSFKKSRIISI